MLEIWLKVDHFLTQISASREKINHSLNNILLPGKQKENKAVKSVFTKKQR